MYLCHVLVENAIGVRNFQYHLCHSPKCSSQTVVDSGFVGSEAYVSLGLMLENYTELDTQVNIYLEGGWEGFNQVRGPED